MIEVPLQELVKCVTITLVTVTDGASVTAQYHTRYVCSAALTASMY
jgi:hypothetical protein